MTLAWLRTRTLGSGRTARSVGGTRPGWSLVFGLYVRYFPLLGLALFVGRN